ncbi:MAG: hypothetical protein KTU85_07125 [Acidimicrobiia bacterium]|nr:hypothetical protein [Acidimicrobiia bacterium]MCY4456781.1 hypothetical protein [Acidimicrobiaceae bacterium]
MTDLRLPDGSSDNPEEQTDLEAGDALETVTVAQSEEVVETAVVQDAEGSSIEMAMYQRESPLPAPSELQAYYDIHPDVCFRLISMAENAANARHEAARDGHRLNATIERSTRSIFLTTVIGLILILLALIFVAGWVATTVNAWVGLGVLVISPTGVLWAVVGFLRRIVRDRSRRDDEDTTDEEEPEN